MIGFATVLACLVGTATGYVLARSPRRLAALAGAALFLALGFGAPLLEGDTSRVAYGAGAGFAVGTAVGLVLELPRIIERSARRRETPAG